MLFINQMKIINKYIFVVCIAFLSVISYSQNTCIFSEKGIHPTTKFCFNNDNYKSAFFLGENHGYVSADDLALVSSFLILRISLFSSCCGCRFTHNWV